MPVRLIAVKNPLESLLVLAEAPCQFAEGVQGAEAQDVQPGALRQPARCRVGQLLDGHPPRQQVAPLGLTHIQKYTWINLGKD